MKKIIALLMTLAMLLSLVACGGGEEDPNAGKYIGKTAQLMGTEVPIEEIYAGENSLELKSGGKGTITLEGDAFKMTWKVDGEKITITIDGEDSTGTLKRGFIVIDFMNMGVILTFEKENRVPSLSEQIEQMVATESTDKKDDTQSSEPIESTQSSEPIENTEAEEPSTSVPETNPAVMIIQQPENVTVAEGETATVTIIASGDGLRYRWYYKNAGDSDYTYTDSFTDNTYSVTMNADRSGRQVLCRVYDQYGNVVQSDSVILSMAKPAETEPPATEAPVIGGEKLDTTLWTLNYGSDAGWVFKQDDFYDSETRSSVILRIPESDEEGAKSLVTVEIRVFLSDPYTFRDWLDSYGFDHYEYAVNNSYDLVKVGGVDCLMYEGTYAGAPVVRYLNRVEGARATVLVEIMGECQDERVASLLSGLKIKLTDEGNVDGPWYWNGTPFSAEPGSATAGNFTLSTQWIPFADCFLTKEVFKHAVAVSGDKAYLLTEGVLKQYAFDGSNLTYEADIKLDGAFENIYAAEDGSLWLGKFMQPLINVKDGEVVASYEDPDYIAMHPSGTWGISFFNSSECEKFDVSGGTFEVSDITFPEVKSISRLMLDENYIYVCGYAQSDNKYHVFVYNANGDLQMTLDGVEGKALGSITFVAKTDNGFIALDGNMRKVVLWDNEGNHIDSIDDGDLFGTFYPWFCGATMLEDGSILVIMTEDREDKSAMELVAFVLSGF